MHGSHKTGALYGSASSILERAKSQLQGKRFGEMTRSAGSLNRSIHTEDAEEDGLMTYLSKLSKKTLRKGERNLKQDGDLSDISISSEEGFGVANSSLNASRFLKKSHSQTLTSETAKEVGKSSAKPLRKSATVPDFLHQTAPAYTSSALQKAAQLGAKFAKKKAVFTEKKNLDKDDDLRVDAAVPSNNDFNSEKDQWKSNTDGGNIPFKTTPKKSFYVSESDDSSVKTYHDDSSDRDENRFLKKSTQPSKYNTGRPKKIVSPDRSDDLSSGVSVNEVPASRFLKKKLPGTTSADGFLTSTPKKKPLQTQNTRYKGGISRTASLMSSSHLGMSLDSDEEDLKEFIANLTPTSSPEVPPVRDMKKNQYRNHSKNADNHASTIQPCYTKSATPGPTKRVSSGTSSESENSFAENRNSLSDGEVGGCVANIMPIKDLEPAISLGHNQHDKNTKINIPKKSTKEAWNESDIENTEEIPSETEDKDHTNWNLTGLQSVDDLLLRHHSESSEEEDKHVEYGNDFEIDTEIATHRTEEVPEESNISDLQSSKNVHAVDTYSSVHSVSKSISESSTRTVPNSYNSFEKTNSHSTSSRSYLRSSYSSRIRTRSGKWSTSEQTHTYSEDFQSTTEDRTDTELEDLTSEVQDTSTVMQSHDFTSLSEKTVKKKRTDKNNRKGMRDAAVQADGMEDLLHHWITDSDFTGIRSADQMEPTPVASHVINPVALQALTNFSPSLLALNDSLMAQLQNARESVQNSLRLHKSLVNSIEKDYEYTTLENTKEFIARHRRPKLTMKQALILVKREMEEDSRL